MTEYAFLQFPTEAIQIAPATLEELPASARQVLGAVRERGPLTHPQLTQATGLPPRTIRYAVRRLKQSGVVESMASLRDCRVCYFFVSRKHIHPDALEAARVRADAAGRDGRLIQHMLTRPARPYGMLGFAPAAVPNPIAAQPAPAGEWAAETPVGG